MSDETKVPPYDPAPLLTHAALLFQGILILFVAGIIGIQIWAKGEANTESWAALTGLIGWSMGVNSGLYNNRFGSTAQSASKDSTIEQQARTAAVIAGAVPAAPPQPAPITPAPTNEEK